MTRGNIALLAVLMAAALLWLIGLEPTHIHITGENAPASIWSQSPEGGTCRMVAADGRVISYPCIGTGGGAR